MTTPSVDVVSGAAFPSDHRLAALITPEAWDTLWRSLGAAGAPRPVYAELVRRYAEPHRAYHGLQHLAECLDMRSRLGRIAPSPAEVDLALWFHDAIYDPRAHDNEARSAQWLDEVAGSAGLGAAVRARLRALVLVTRHDGTPDSLDEAVLVDTDLAILGAMPARFDEYDRQIRAEYRHVPEVLYRHKRCQVLRGFNARERIYATQPYFQALEARARTNLGRAIDALG